MKVEKGKQEDVGMLETQTGKQHFLLIPVPNGASSFGQAREPLVNTTTDIRTSPFSVLDLDK